MKRPLIISIVLLVITILVTVVYFKNLQRNGPRTRQVLQNIPDDAALILEFNNDNSFYDIFNESRLFTNVIGENVIADLDTLRNQLLLNEQLEPFFTGQNIFISLHPLKNNTVELLLTSTAKQKFDATTIDELAKQKNTGLLITPFNIGTKKAYTIYSQILKKRFYLVNKEEGIFAGSFSKDLVIESAQYLPKKDKSSFILLPDQQNSNSLANLYVNYSQLTPLFEQLFKNKNTDIFKCFKAFPALAVLSLNFKSDALMFNGYSEIQANQPPAYLNLFVWQQPVTNELKDIFPSTTAYSISFGVSDPQKFKSDLAEYYTGAGLQSEKDSLFNKIKTETGINLFNQFNQLLGAEFAVVTTRYQEKLAIISLKDGSQLKPTMYNIATMSTDNIGQINYNKIPFFILGEAFAQFNHPWFMIVDNYLILANTQNELNSYYDTYVNRKFQSKSEQYKQFDNLVAEQSNVSWYINFNQSQSILERDLNQNFYNFYNTNTTGWKNFYAASYQLTAVNKKFYTNFCMRLNPADSVSIK
ncbi:hypothetical protein GCM10027049_12260 [Mucilaginibacter puniceus]